MKPFKILSVSETLLKLQEKNVRLIDIRDPNTFQTGHIPLAEHLSSDQLLTFLEKEPKDQHYIICCYRGNSSQQIARILSENEFEHVYNLDGGFQAWSDAAATQSEYKIVTA